MSAQYVPLPYQALTIAGGDHGALAVVVHLYTQGHMTRWTWLRLSISRLVRVTGASKHHVERVLEALVSDGLGERETVTKGGRLEGTRLRLFDPGAKSESDTGTRSTGPPAGRRPPRAGRPKSSDTGSDTDRTRERASRAHPRDLVRHGPDTGSDTPTDLTDPIDRRSIPPTPRERGASPQNRKARRVRWVVERAIADLFEAFDSGPDQAEVTARRWAGRSHELAALVTKHVRAGSIPRWQDPPTGLRLGDVADGLERAAHMCLAHRGRRAGTDAATARRTADEARGRTVARQLAAPSSAPTPLTRGHSTDELGTELLPLGVAPDADAVGARRAAGGAG